MVLQENPYRIRRQNPYVNDLKGCDTHIMSAKQVIEENIFREDYLYRKASSLGSEWKFNIYLEDVERFGKILISENTDQNTPEIPPMNVGETAMYFAYEAEVLKGIPRPRFNLALIEALQKNIDRILDGKDAEGLSSNFLQNTPPLPNFAAAFSIALPTEIRERIKSCEHEYWNAFGTFSRSLRRAYGQVGGWSKLYYGRKPEDKLPIRKDWGKELIHRKIELALLTNKCFDDVELLINTLRVYGGMCGNFGNGSLYFKPHLTRLNPLTKQERARRDRAEKERHKKQWREFENKKNGKPNSDAEEHMEVIVASTNSTKRTGHTSLAIRIRMLGIPIAIATTTSQDSNLSLPLVEA